MWGRLHQLFARSGVANVKANVVHHEPETSRDRDHTSDINWNRKPKLNFTKSLSVESLNLLIDPPSYRMAGAARTSLAPGEHKLVLHVGIPLLTKGIA